MPTRQQPLSRPVRADRPRPRLTSPRRPLGAGGTGAPPRGRQPARAAALGSPFTFFRGAAYLLAAHPADDPRTALHTQLCGDARRRIEDSSSASTTFFREGAARGDCPLTVLREAQLTTSRIGPGPARTGLRRRSTPAARRAECATSNRRPCARSLRRGSA
jgi:hypothetical protein